MTLITAYGNNGKIFSIWRVSPKRREFRFHKGDRLVAEFETRSPELSIRQLDYRTRDILKGHQPLIDGLLKHLENQ